MKLDETIGKLLGCQQRQWDVTVTSRDERNAVSDEDRNDADDELVDRLRIEKRGDDFTAAHQPDILALAFSQAMHEHRDCLVGEFDGWRSIARTRMAREALAVAQGTNAVP